MKKYCRTDLACEADAELAHIEGTEYRIEERSVCVIERLDILSDKAAERLGKKKGRYVTVNTPRLQYLGDEEIDALACVIAEEVSSLLCSAVKRKSIDRELSVLVAGLGNSKITADAVGPETVDRLTVTRHLKDRDIRLFDMLNMCSVSAISPSVLGKTGMESADLIRAATEKISPDALIVIDALAARSVSRLARTIQITDTGLTPGAGIGNIRSELSLQSLKLPVIAIGIPTVVDSATMVYDALSDAGIAQLSKEISSGLDAIENFFVTPKETDSIIESAAMLLARSLNEAFVIRK